MLAWVGERAEPYISPLFDPKEECAKRDFPKENRQIWQVNDQWNGWRD